VTIRIIATSIVLVNFVNRSSLESPTRSKLVNFKSLVHNLPHIISMLIVFQLTKYVDIK